jgi:hypothetical protein
VVHEVRGIARTVIGYPSTDEETDRHILRAWRNRIDGAALVREASEPRDPPVPNPVRWVPDEDPAAEVLGARIVPSHEIEALDLLREMLGLRRTRRLELGLLYDRLAEERLYVQLGFSSLSEMARKSLPLTQRTLQNCRVQARAVSFYPELRMALEAGMDLARALAIFEAATEDNVVRWLAVANRTTVTELRRAVRWVGETAGDEVLETYEQAIEEANDAHTWVALRAARRPERPPRRLEGVDPDLVEACRWYREAVRLPRQTGFSRVKERERFTCEGPLCNRTSLRCHAHHKRFKREGGGDEDGNARCVCTACHHRGIHADDQITLTGEEGRPDLWTYPSGRRVLVF